MCLVIQPPVLKKPAIIKTLKVRENGITDIDLTGKNVQMNGNTANFVVKEKSDMAQATVGILER